MSESKKVHNYNKKIAIRNYETSLNDYYSKKFENKVTSDLQKKQQKDQYVQSMRIRDMQNDAQLQAFEKSEESFVDQLAYNEQAEQIALQGEENVFKERILQTAFQTDELSLAFENQILQSRFKTADADTSIANAVEDLGTEKAIAKLQLDQDKQQLATRGKQIDLQEQSSRADFNTKRYEANIERLQREGSVRAQGRRGNTAARGLQSVTALAGVNAALIADQLTKSNAKIEVERAALKAEGGFAERRSALAVDSAEIKKRRTETQAKESKIRIAKVLGIEAEQFEMSQEQLGRSLLSAADSFEQRSKEILKDRFAADIRAYAARQLKPQLQPEIPVPFKTPLPVLTEPPAPIKPIKSKLVGAQSERPSTVGSLMGIGGSMMTAGAAFAPTGVGLPLALAGAAISGIGSLF